jgi:PilZ domain
VRPDATFGPRVETRTLDVSAGGALVHRPAGLEGFPAYRVTLTLPGGAGELTAAAQSIRIKDATIALRFAGLEIREEARLAQVVLDAVAAETGAPRAQRPPRTDAPVAAAARQARVDELVAGARAS